MLVSGMGMVVCANNSSGPPRLALTAVCPLSSGFTKRAGAQLANSHIASIITSCLLLFFTGVNDILIDYQEQSGYRLHKDRAHRSGNDFFGNKCTIVYPLAGN